MGLWVYRIAIALLLGAAAGLVATAFAPSWDTQLRALIRQLTPTSIAEPTRSPVAEATPNRVERLSRCADPNAIPITEYHDLADQRPRPELSVRSDAKAGRAIPLELALIVKPDGSVACAEAVSGHPPYRSTAEKLALLWRFTPFMRDGKPITALVHWDMPLRWLDRRPPKVVPFPQIVDRNSLRITLTRQRCYGTCPSYRVQVSGDGGVEYHGGAFVALLGKHKGRISQEAVAKLLDQFRRADFFWLNDSYVARITDQSSYDVEIAFDGHKKRVHDYIGLTVGMPDAVTNLEYAIDDATDSERWTKGNKNTAPSLVAEGWNFKSPANENRSIVAGLAAYGEPEALRAVIAAGAPVTADVETRQSHFEPHRTSTGLETAVARGDPEILHILLSTGRWTHPRLDEALLSAAQYGRMSIVSPLIRAGANPLYVTPSKPPPAGERYRGPGEGGRTVLMNAADSGHPDVVEVILRSKPDVRAREDYGWTALHFAVERTGRSYSDAPPTDRPRVVELLLAAGADINARTRRGATPLSLTTDNDTMRVLVKAGAR